LFYFRNIIHAHIVKQTLAALKEGGKVIHSTQMFFRPMELTVILRMLRNPKDANYYINLLSHPEVQNELAADDVPIFNAREVEHLGAKGVKQGDEGGYFYLSYSK
jgi:hypothetical protein